MTASIGQQLRTAREARRISLEQVSQATHIRVRYLQALEAGDLGSLPSQAQARGFLRAYGDYLGLNSEELMRQLDSPPAQDAAANPPPEQPDRPVEAPEDTQQSDRIFKEIGQDLRRQRELLGLTLEDVARHTHLRAPLGSTSMLPLPLEATAWLNTRFLSRRYRVLRPVSMTM